MFSLWFKDKLQQEMTHPLPEPANILKHLNLLYKRYFLGSCFKKLAENEPVTKADQYRVSEKQHKKTCTFATTNNKPRQEITHALP